MNFKITVILLLFFSPILAMDSNIDPVFLAVDANNIYELKNLINRGMCIDKITFTNGCHYSPLLRAIEMANLKATTILLQAKPKLSFKQALRTSKGELIYKEIDALRFAKKILKKLKFLINSLALELIEEDCSETRELLHVCKHNYNCLNAIKRSLLEYI